MKRRGFIAGAGALVGGVAGGGLAGCGDNRRRTASSGTASRDKVRHWRMVTAWPKNFPLLGTGAEALAETITKLSGGRFQVKVYAAGELVPAFEIFDAVAEGVAEMGHGASYYWKGKNPAFQFFSSVPFGMNHEGMNAWLYEGGGLELWEEAYAPFGVVPMPVGNTCIQMAGWFNREINDIEDLRGLKMRTPGLGGEVLRRIGGVPVTLPGGELLTAMQTGVIDAAEWMNPYGDLAFGLHKVAKYYYYPGWQEPGVTIECIVRRDVFEELPEDLRAVVRVSAAASNQRVMVESTARNDGALKELREVHKISVRRLPDQVLAELKKVAESVVRELGERDEFARRVHQSYARFQRRVLDWHSISEKVYYEMQTDPV